MEKEARSKEMVEGEGGGWVANLEVMEDDGWKKKKRFQKKEEAVPEDEKFDPPFFLIFIELFNVINLF
jgi:hypothetical protein